MWDRGRELDIVHKQYMNFIPFSVNDFIPFSVKDRIKRKRTTRSTAFPVKVAPNSNCPGALSGALGTHRWGSGTE